MKKLLVSALFLFSLLFGPLANAGGGTYTIKSIGVSASSNSIWVDIEEQESQSECELHSRFRYQVTDENIIGKELYSLLLSAHVANRRVYIKFTDPVASCLYGSPQILYAVIK